MTLKNLFGSGVQPACLHCEQSHPSPDKVMVLCRRFGPVSPHYKCKKYRYDPLKRTPRPMPKLPAYAAEDFEV